MRLRDALHGYWLDREVNLSPNTVADYRRTFGRLMEFLDEDRAVEEITARDLNRFLNEMTRRYGWGNKTRLNAWIALSSLWTWAERTLGVDQVVRDGVSRPTVRRSEIRPYTQVEVRALLSACDTTQGWDSINGRVVLSRRPTAVRDRAIMLVMLDTGIRVSELAGLLRRDYVRDRGLIHVRHGKGGKVRTLALGRSTQRALWHYLATRSEVQPGSPLFATKGGGPLDRHTILKMVARAGERSGVPRANCHRFRHTFAITFLRNGGSVLELQEMLGHERMDTVRIYARLAQIDLERAQRRASVADRWGL